ncbi:histidine kinase [Arcicella sp. LKC2W]|uniref:sensor histidine kinase n=1 Tax=Arcicella sp. LKC2W TaxID=2984198 RepID=UPI002B213F6F|nr:histidine kinase [Arcicella sp. LKC2W]MEA5461325.1 histidine kinase [Arcicella sp. LKC2W]
MIIKKVSKNQESIFWKLHLTWWVIYLGYRTLPTCKLPEGPFSTILFFYVLNFSSMVIITYLYRAIYLKIDLDSVKKRWQFLALLIGISICGGVYFLINSHGFFYHYSVWEGKKITTEMRFDYLLECIWNSLPWFLGFHLFRYAQILKERESNLLKSLHDSELDRLRKQLNPHFLFNALNGIRALVLTEPHSAREAIAQLSDLLRLSLKTKLDENISLGEEIEILDNYLSIEKIRFHERLTVEIKISNDLKNFHVLPFCLQILAENAIKHGIGKQKKGGTIKIYGEKNQTHLLLKVINEGTLESKPSLMEENTGIGIENLQKRLKINFGDKAFFKLEEQNHLITASLGFPLEN